MVPGAGKVTLSGGSQQKRPAAGAGALAQAKAEAAAKAAPAEVRLEDKVLAIPALKGANEPQIFREFCQKLAPRLVLERTSRTLLQEFASIDVTAERVAAVIRSNPYYEDQFYRIIEAMGKRESTPSLEGAVVMLGMQNSRNLIIALQLIRMVRGTHPEWGKDGRLKVAPNEVVRYALRAEEAVNAAKNEYADVAFGAGLIFDLLTLIADQEVEEKKKVIAYIEALFNHGLRTAQIGESIVKSMPDFAYRKYLYSACLTHDMGKAALAILNPRYLEFVELCGKKELPRAVRLVAEEKRFGMNHAMAGGMMCHYFHILRPIKRAIYYHHDPYLLRFRNRNLYQLTALVCLATNVANNYKKTEKTDDPILALWKGPDLQDFGIDNRTLITAVGRAGQ